MKLNNTEYKVALVLAKFIVIFFSLGVYLFKFLLIQLIRARRVIYKATLIILAVSLTSIFQSVAYAPKVPAFAYVEQPKTEKEQIVNYIYERFGKYGADAVRVFTCESGLNPKAFNDNTKWGGVGRDWGVAQINDSWQGVTNKAFLLDWHTNINMAKVIFVNRGENFDAWTCKYVLK